MPSYLDHYEGRYGKAAENRIEKFHRAVNSVRSQVFSDWELIIVSDGCEKTCDQWSRFPDDNIRLLRISKQRLWSHKVRNAGIDRGVEIVVEVAVKGGIPGAIPAFFCLIGLEFRQRRTRNQHKGGVAFVQIGKITQRIHIACAAATALFPLGVKHEVIND